MQPNSQIADSQKISEILLSVAKSGNSASQSAAHLTRKVLDKTPELQKYSSLQIEKIAPLQIEGDHLQRQIEQTCQLDRALNKLINEIFDAQIRKQLVEATKLNASWLSDYLANKSELRIKITDYIQSHTGATFPWPSAQPTSEGIAILYNFSPFQDTGATVASKRIREMAKTVDVISCSFLHKKKQDTTVETIAAPYVASRYFLPLSPSWASWEPFSTFTIKANEYAETLLKKNPNYKFLYTRAMWAPSHFAGALFKFNHPEIHWIAEFSDPLSLDVEGLPRGIAIPEDDLSGFFISQLLEQYPDINQGNISVFSLAELLPYAFADELLFTNSNQLQTMLEHVPSDKLKKRVKAHAKVSNHPTLPREYYSFEKTDYEVDPSVVNLGYFGEFYSSRSITEVTAAMRTLPEHLAERVHLHVFTNYIPAGEGNRRPRNLSKRQFDDLVKRAYDGVGAQGIEHRVTFNPSLPYLKFLATTEKLDFLIVNDAKSGLHHEINPYLPSKWSDYAGSSAKTWGFIEDGSILSTKPVDIKTPIGDALCAREQLWEIITAKFSETDNSSGDDL
ncbi:hypothetical protein [Corynebacterium glutamicum]|uniref:hypothetical protein n=1 Tax=Corynebacterium glutamicum TaxID=1718 RepID=UPI00117D32AF|nr:hypothetical protein [Corynebacterium glutamicum]QDQ19945.1 hypothetical protein FOL53_03605 [Corynebacterium glutamicum]QDQ23512.1 hypothetical protein FOY32_08235 [Corynebacterium glutamicum]